MNVDHVAVVHRHRAFAPFGREGLQVRVRHLVGQGVRLGRILLGDLTAAALRSSVFIGVHLWFHPAGPTESGV